MVSPARRPTLFDVARLSGVSPGTASRALNPNRPHPVSAAVERRVREVARQLDYHPSAAGRVLLGGYAPLIGAIVHDVVNSYVAEIVRAIEDAAARQGHMVVICNSDRSPEKELQYVRLLRELGVAGVIFTASNLSDPSYEQELGRQVSRMRRIGMGVVSLTTRRTPMPTVRFDNVEAALMATNAVLAEGHRRVAMLAGQEMLWTAQQRVDGYRSAMQTAGVPLDESLVTWNPGFTREAGARATRGLLDRGAVFTAIVCSNDEMAAGAQLALFENGLRVPDDVSLVGIDDLPPAAYMSPPLTTVHAPLKELGEKSVELLMKYRGRGWRPSAPEDIVLPTTLVRRQSIAQPRLEVAAFVRRKADPLRTIT
jgi:LacI family transcriptional regulator